MRSLAPGRVPSRRGAAAFRQAVAAAGVPDDRVHFELFDGGHGAIEYRHPLAITWLSGRPAG
ncbi:hypothetical protein [Actinomadura sp. B10D3]|uniref:hypothetical protein n=1 Tax=Actinomadura sp. B10D3 TaxID=3153557 RepID=UPI00325E414D